VLAVVITGPPGAGKTSVMTALVDALSDDDIAHASSTARPGTICCSSSAPPGPTGCPSCRNGVSKTDAKTRANAIVSGTASASVTTKAGTPCGTRPATSFS
jgi:GTPase SAR1 family protein